MIYQTKIDYEIDVMHRVDGLGECGGRTHPHQLIVSVTVEGDPQAAEGMAVITAADSKKIRAIIDEYADRDINPLLGASVPSIAGLTMVLMERMSMIPGVTGVSVVQDWSDKICYRHIVER